MTRTRLIRRSARPLALAAGTLVLAGIVATAPAAAASAPAAAVPAVAGSAVGQSAAAETAPVMIVLDASGSMNEDDAPGPRIDAAKTAVRDLVAGLPDEARVGLTVYGTNTGSSDAEKTAGCQDITQLAPVGKVDKPALTAAVDGIRASGYTPIGASLQKAAAALPNEGPRSVVLVSDGEDTCSPPPPCDVAQQLKQQGVDLTVHTVGFKVDDAARAQLTCIAQATGGTYSDAQDAGSLGVSIDQQVGRALEPYETVGKAVDGGTGPGDAPTLEPGQYTDTLGIDGDLGGSGDPEAYYAVELAEGETPYFSATVVPPSVREDQVGAVGVNVIITFGSGVAGTDPCTKRVNEFNQSVQDKFATTTAVLTPGEVGGADWPSDCPTSGTFVFGVAREGGGDVDLPTELAFRNEPRVASTAGLPPAATQQSPAALPTPSSDVTPVTAGSSYNSAPELTSGRTVSDTVVFGEDRYFKVHLDWGQRLSWRLDAAALPDLGSLDGVQSRVDMANPVRAAVAENGRTTDNAESSLGFEAASMSNSTLYPVRWNNRTAESDLQPYAIDGDYYLVFSTGFPSDGTSVELDYTLTVDVLGDPEDGPDYAQQADTSSTASGANGAGSNGSGGTTVNAEPAGWTTQRTTLVGGSVVLAVIAAGVLGWLLLGRRTPRPATPPIMPPGPGPGRRD